MMSPKTAETNRTMGRGSSAIPRSRKMPARTANSAIGGWRIGAGRPLVAVVRPEVLPGEPGDQVLETLVEPLRRGRLLHALEVQPPALPARQALAYREHDRGARLGREPLGQRHGERGLAEKGRPGAGALAWHLVG